MAPQSSTGVHERILNAATDLFDRYGVHSVGMQKVIDEAGCGKHSLYDEFGSKDDLVVAYLHRHERNWELTLAAALASSDRAEDQLIEVVRLVGAGLPGTRGCPIRNTHREFPDPGHPVHSAAMEHFGAVREQLCEVTRRTASSDPERLADRIILIINGLFSSGSVLTAEANVETAVQLVQDVILVDTTVSSID